MSSKLLILHETDGKVYFPALDLAAVNLNYKVIYRESSVIRLLIWDVLVGKKPLLLALKKSIKNFYFRALEQFNFRGDCILCFAPYDFRLFFYLPLLYNNRCIFHTSWPNWLGEDVPRGNFKPLKCFYKRVMSDRECVAVTNTAARSVKSFCPNLFVTQIPHVANTVHLDDNISVSEFDLPSNYICFIGKLVCEKGIRQLLTIASQLSNYNFVFIGDGPLMGELSKTAKVLKNIFVLGHIKSREKLCSILSRSDLLVVPSQRRAGWEELFGIVIIEAFAVGVPVLSSNHCGPNSIVKKYKDFFLVDDSQWEKPLFIELKIKEILIRKKCFDLKKISKRYSVNVVSVLWKRILVK